MAKQSGGTRNYRGQSGTMRQRRDEYDTLLASGDYDASRSRFDNSGGFYIMHKDHNKVLDSNIDKSAFAVDALAQKGYKVYLDSEKNYIEFQKTADGRLYKSVMEIKTINSAGSSTINNALNQSAKQGASVAVIQQNTPDMTRGYVEKQIDWYRKTPRNKGITQVIVIGSNGAIHRHKI